MKKRKKEEVERRGRRGEGSAYRVKGSTFIYISYRGADGRRVVESTKQEKLGVARQTLRDRTNAIKKNQPVIREVEQTTFEEIATDYTKALTLKGRSYVDSVERRLRLHILPVFGHLRIVNISAAELRAFAAKRQAAGASNAEINRELAVVRGALRLAVVDRRLGACPPVPRLEEAPPREGFFEATDVASIVRHLPADLRPVVEVFYETGWRKREVLDLEWSRVDLKAGTVTLAEGSTKSGDARKVFFTPKLREIFEARDRERKKLAKRGIITPLVFFRMRHGKPAPVRDLRKVWKNATKAAGVPGRMLHDFRRTVVRDLDKAGVPRKVQMEIVGHKTESINLRYRIVDESDKIKAAETLGAFRAGVSSSKTTSRRRGGSR